MNLFTDLANLLFPEFCVTCDDLLVFSERILCTRCLYEMPRTRFVSLEDNPVSRLFWGRVEIQSAYSLFQYNRGSRYQNLVHDLKYRDRPVIGLEMGRLMGAELMLGGKPGFELLVPVPLHKRKKRKRGYNQCDPVCMGLSEKLNIPFLPDALVKESRTGSQTDKSRILRWVNVEGGYRVQKAAPLEGKHILLVDDVVTTGSTLEACAAELLKVDGTCVSVATMGVSMKRF